MTRDDITDSWSVTGWIVAAQQSLVLGGTFVLLLSVEMYFLYVSTDTVF